MFGLDINVCMPINGHYAVEILPEKLCNFDSIEHVYLRLMMTSINKRYYCSGPPAFKSQRVEYQSNQKLLHH